MPNKPGGMGGYARELGKHPLSGDIKKVADAFARPRSEGYEALEKLGLPCLERYSDSADTLIKEFDTRIPQDKEHKWFVALDPKDGTAHTERVRQQGLDRDGIVTFVEEQLRTFGATPE